MSRLGGHVASLYFSFCILCPITVSAELLPPHPCDKSQLPADSGRDTNPGQSSNLGIALPILPIDTRQVRIEVKNGLLALKGLLKDKGKYDPYANVLGFASIDEAAQAQEGKHLPIYQIPLDMLIRYTRNLKPIDFLTSLTPTVLVPLVVDQQIRSSFMIAKLGEAKQVRIIGQGISNILRDKTPRNIADIDGIVTISELRITFLMRRSQTGIILIPVTNYSLFRLEKNKEYAATQVLSELQPIAKKAAKAFADDSEEDIAPAHQHSHQQSR